MGFKLAKLVLISVLEIMIGRSLLSIPAVVQEHDNSFVCNARRRMRIVSSYSYRAQETSDLDGNRYQLEMLIQKECFA